MATTTMTAWQTASAKWQRVKPFALALGLGLVAGPIITNMAGLQMLSSTAKTHLAEGLVQMQATFCDTQARAEVPEPGKLDWNLRNKLAERFAVMPGSTKASYEVISACSRKLSS